MSVASRLRATTRLPGAPELVVFLAALVPRLGLIVRSGGARGDFGYDPSVYYAAAAALVQHRAPYRDFVLLHPPGLMLFLTPFAWFGNLTTDHRGFAAASLAFLVLGAVNAVLVARVGTRAGFGRGAAFAGGIFYAVWPGTADAEFTIELETLGSFLLLCGLLAYYRAETSQRRRWPVLCGAAMGAAVAVKIWWAVPFLLLAGWQFGPARRRRLAYYLAGGAAALVVLDAPFFALAPHRMWSMIVTDQLGRGRYIPAAERLTGLTGIRLVDVQFADGHPGLIVAVATLLVLAAIVPALRAPGGVLPVALLVVTVAVLLAAPTWFAHYNGLFAPGLALTITAAASALRGMRPVGSSAPLRWGLVALAACAAAAALVTATALPKPPVHAYPSAAFARAVRHLHCVMADAPMPLIEMDVLTRDLRNGCPNWVDVTGRAYEVIGSGGDLPARRRTDPQWQRDMVRYLSAGQAFTVYRPLFTGIGAPLTQLMHRHPVLARGDGHTLYAG